MLGFSCLLVFIDFSCFAKLSYFSAYNIYTVYLAPKKTDGGIGVSGSVDWNKSPYLGKLGVEDLRIRLIGHSKLECIFYSRCSQDFFCPFLNN